VNLAANAGQGGRQLHNSAEVADLEQFLALLA
jgi:hypothetical protein